MPAGSGSSRTPRDAPSRELLDRALAGLACGRPPRRVGGGRRHRRRRRACCCRCTRPLTGVAGAGLAMCFLREPWLRGVVEDACRAEGLEPAGWRDVPLDVARSARRRSPRCRASPSSCSRRAPTPTPSVRAYRARRRAELVDGVYVASLSFRTVTYKALCAATQLASVLPATCASRGWHVAWAIFHQRFSTNTEPSWERAQPFRLLCHNGEINTIEGNVAWMEARERASGAGRRARPGARPRRLGLGAPRQRARAARPLRRGGRARRVARCSSRLPGRTTRGSTTTCVRCTATTRCSSSRGTGLRASCSPTGSTCGAALDRNGLRPLRVAVCSDGLVAVSPRRRAPSRCPKGSSVRRGAARPGAAALGRPGARRAVRRRAEARRSPRRGRTLAGSESRSSHRAPGGAAARRPTTTSRARHALFGYTREELSLMLRPIAQTGRDPVYSMGDDAPHRAARRPRATARLVLPPALRPGHEPGDRPLPRAGRDVGGHARSGPGPALDADGPRARPSSRCPSFLLTPDGLAGARSRRASTRRSPRPSCSPTAVERVADACAGARVEAGATVVCVSDRGGGRRARARSPRCSRSRRRTAGSSSAACGPRARWSVQSDEPRDSHMVATLVGYGADAICPRLALETVAQLAATDKVGGDRPSPEEAQPGCSHALEDGVLKVMAKMGISDVASYRGARLFEAVGLDRRLCRRFFGGHPVGDRRHRPRPAASAMRSSGSPRASAERVELENPGFYKFRKGGEPHATDPEVVAALQESVTAAHALQPCGPGRAARRALRPLRRARQRASAARAARPARRSSPPARPSRSTRWSPSSSIVRRFSGGAMSHGALSAEAHETIAIALNRLGARSNSGEGGEDPARYRTQRNSTIKQIASGALRRHRRVRGLGGRAADQGRAGIEAGRGRADPRAQGDGGDRPAPRHTRPGVALISPPPHHDIYSIEDLAQLVFDLKEVNPDADVSVKLVA